MLLIRKKMSQIFLSKIVTIGFVDYFTIIYHNFCGIFKITIYIFLNNLLINITKQLV